MAGWNNLPREIQLLIWEDLAKEGTRITPNDPNILSQYATVNRDWQTFFEERTFRELLIIWTPASLNHFRQVVGGDRIPRVDRTLDGVDRRSYVRKLHLHLQPQEYRCGLCSNVDKKRLLEASKEITEAIHSLFNTLSNWDAESHRGLRFQLSVAFKIAPLGSFICDSCGTAVELPSIFESRALSPILALTSPTLGYTLRRVEVITEFCVERHYRNQLTPSALTWVLQGLPRLRHLRLGTWWRIDKSSYLSNRASARVLEHWDLPTTLRSLVLIQNFDYRYSDPEIGRFVQDIGLCLSLARASAYLTDLCVWFMVDAEDYFWCLSHLSVKPANLKRLSLTSPWLLKPDRRSEDLLVAAAEAALQMPRLETMEIWHSLPFRGTVFRYERHYSKTEMRYSCVVTCISTWSFGLWPWSRSRAAWENVALRHCQRPGSLTIRTASMMNPSSDNAWEARYLKLASVFLHPSTE